ncbi:hypothetical protein ScPMuIL_013836 [Solemya velum]
MSKPPSWKQFVTGKLLCHNVLSGVVLMSCQAQPFYTFGELEHLTPEDLKQFLNAFTHPQRDDGSKTSPRSFHIRTSHTDYMDFKVYQKSYCSIYATSEGSSDGLVICNLPYGLLVCTYHRPIQDGHAIQVIENFCDLLRA